MGFSVKPVLVVSTDEAGNEQSEVKDLEVLEGVTYNGSLVTEIDFDEAREAHRIEIREELFPIREAGRELLAADAGERLLQRGQRLDLQKRQHLGRVGHP